MNKKKYFAVLSSVAIGGLIASVITTSVSAKVTSYIVDNYGQAIRFNSDDLLKDYTNKLSGSPAPMFDEYMKHSSQLTAFEDSVKGFVSYDSVMKAYKDKLLQNKENEFKIDSITENASAADIKNITVGYEWKDGSIVPVSADNTVSEVKPINLNQFEIIFNTNVNKDTAESTSNYKVDGIQLNDTNSHVELTNGNTVRVTLVRAELNTINQGDEKAVSVKKGILTEDKTKTIETCYKNIEFKDIEAPTVKNVSVNGNNTLVIEFSEAVNISNLSKVAALIEVDGKTLSNYNADCSAPKEAATNGTETWANKVEFYLNSGLTSGKHTVRVKNADNGVLVDAAGFASKETDTTVTVDDVYSTAPEVKEISCTDDGDIGIKFDRPMDPKTAVNYDYYQINDQNINGAKLELVEGNTVVKITNIPEGIVDEGINVLTITADVKDAYGNKMDDHTRKAFDKEKDEIKPTVLSATIIDSNTLRVQFSEDVKYAYATKLDNYKLKDANGVDIISKSGVYIKAALDADEKVKADTDTYDIKLDKTSAPSCKFDSSKYTLTVSDIIDTAADPNKMDDQTISIDGSQDLSLSVKASLKSSSATEVAINFGSEMESSSICDRSNYYYISGDGEAEDLPANVDITVSSNYKSVVLDFKDANKTVNPSATSGTNVVKEIGIKTIKDASGKEFHPGALTIGTILTNGPKLEENTFKLYKDGDDVKAEFQLDNALDTVNVADFKVSGIAADAADADVDKVILTFNEGDKADSVLALGSAAVLQISPSSTNPSEDIGGRKIVAASQKVYHNNISPETDRDNYKATVTVDSSSKATGAKVYITLKTPVDADILGSYKDDFIFTNATKGTNLGVESVEMDKTGDEPTLIFTIKDAETKVANGDSIDITASSDDDDIDLRSQEDGDGSNTVFVPTPDDLKVKAVKVTAVNK